MKSIWVTWLIITCVTVIGDGLGKDFVVVKEGHAREISCYRL